MKMILVAYNQGLDDRVMGTLERCCLQNYTKWTSVLGQGNSSGPHLATHVWPKANHVLAVVVEDAVVEPFIEQIRKMRAELAHEGIKAFVLPLEEVT